MLGKVKQQMLYPRPFSRWMRQVKIEISMTAQYGDAGGSLGLRTLFCLFFPEHRSELRHHHCCIADWW